MKHPAMAKCESHARLMRLIEDIEDRTSHLNPVYMLNELKDIAALVRDDWLAQRQIADRASDEVYSIRGKLEDVSHEITEFAKRVGVLT